MTLLILTYWQEDIPRRREAGFIWSSFLSVWLRSKRRLDTWIGVYSDVKGLALWDAGGPSSGSSSVNSCFLCSMRTLSSFQPPLRSWRSLEDLIHGAELASGAQARRKLVLFLIRLLRQHQHTHLTLYPLNCSDIHPSYPPAHPSSQRLGYFFVTVTDGWEKQFKGAEDYFIYSFRGFGPWLTGSTVSGLRQDIMANIIMEQVAHTVARRRKNRAGVKVTFTVMSSSWFSIPQF